MLRRRLACSLLAPIATLAGCFSPRDPIIVSDSDSGATESGTDATMGPGSDPTMSSSTEPTGSTAPTTSTTSSTTDTADSSTSGTDTSGSTDDGGPLCGNGMPDDDEACDDGNEINGDGCNVDCVESGTLLWEVVVPGDGSQYAIEVAVSDDVVAFLWSDGDPHIDTFDREGAASDSVEGPADASWRSVAFFGNGDLAVSLQGDSPLEIARVTPTGAELWSSGPPGVVNDDGYAAIIAITDDDDVAFAGTGDAAIWAGKFDGGGAFDWSDVVTVAAPGWARGYGIACEPDGTCVVSGVTDSNGNTSGGKELFLRRLTPGGVEIWTSTYEPDSGYLEGCYVAVAPTGDIAVAAYDNDNDLVLGFASDGDLQWTNVGVDLYPYKVASDIDGNFVVVGNGSRDDFSEGVNALTRKFDADGNELWTRAYNSGGTQDDEARSVATDSTGRILVVGETDVDGSYDAWIRAYAP